MTSSFLDLLSMTMLSEVRFEQSEVVHLFLLCGDSLLKHFKDSSWKLSNRKKLTRVESKKGQKETYFAGNC